MYSPYWFSPITLSLIQIFISTCGIDVMEIYNTTEYSHCCCDSCAGVIVSLIQSGAAPELCTDCFQYTVESCSIDGTSCFVCDHCVEWALSKVNGTPCNCLPPYGFVSYGRAINNAILYCWVFYLEGEVGALL